MSDVLLELRQAHKLRADLRGITPATCAGRSAAEIAQLPIGLGRDTVPLGELFKVVCRADGSDTPVLRLEGDLSACDRIGWQMAAGRLIATGSVGDHAGGGMSGGELLVQGDAGALAACEMAGGVFTVQGNVGDFAASPLPGSMDGMRGGRFIVKGHAGERFADRMRRGSAIVFGDTGDFAASRLVAGTVAIGGRTGAHLGYGMRRGSVVLAGPAPQIPPTFVPALTEAEVFWQLLARDLARDPLLAGGPFDGLVARRIQRHLGDLAADGRGELILVR